MPLPPGTPDRYIPRHVAIIMDGNGRWAEARGRPRSFGHQAGTENVRQIIQAFAERGVQVLTLFAFSTENWSRPRREVRGLMALLSRTIRREIRPLHEGGVRVRYIGRIDVLSARLRRQIEEAVTQTAGNDRITVCVAFNYGGRAEIVDAVRRLVAEGVAPDAIDEEAIRRRLYAPDLPDPDLVVRTGGEMRLSNFLLWESAYAEFFATPTYWPDFGEAEIEAALAAYAQRIRKYGSLTLVPGGPAAARAGEAVGS